jgi:hypothetical protein
MQDTYGDPKVIETEGAKITLHRPILTEEERTRRLIAIKEASVRLLLTNERTVKE